MQRKQHSGFTLVEILIVVVILGILAAIVIPQFSTASEEARSSNIVTQLQSIRSQLELYQIQHAGDYPTLAQMWDNLTTATEIDGTAGNGDSNDLGPYLQRDPVNAFEASSTVAAAAAAGVGWQYTEATGQIMAVMEATKAADLGMDTVNDIATY